MAVQWNSGGFYHSYTLLQCVLNLVRGSATTLALAKTLFVNGRNISQPLQLGYYPFLYKNEPGLVKDTKNYS